MLNWASRFNIFCFMDNQDYEVEPHRFECLVATGTKQFIQSGSLEDIDNFISENRSWIFGHLSYDLKNQIHGLKDVKENPISFASYFFFLPEQILVLKEDGIEIIAENPQSVYKQISEPVITQNEHFISSLTEQKLSREQYIKKIEKLKAHILRGDCYEINFCQEFFAKDTSFDPLTAYNKLHDISPNPFSVFYRVDENFLLCASPERFIARQGNRICSQPIKGTIKRNLQDKAADERLKKELEQSAKDQSENVMVVDLVRNDLTQICEPGSVEVTELFGVYTYPQVHQMISTIEGSLKQNIRFSEILKACFPMGSMTGAPKHRVLQLIDQYEVSARGIFSGSVGYIDPDGNFDFNVVIRSMMYNKANRYLSYQVGSGITFLSDPEKEWEECILKAEAIRQVLSPNK